MKIVSVVVTYNRKKLLEECVNAIINQSYSCDKIIIVDNNSNDGTDNMLDENGYLKNEKIIYKKLPKNIGGAGGFYEGMKSARELNADWVWIMDDDTIPEKEALFEMVTARKKLPNKVSFLASAVYGMKGNCMNCTEVSTKKDDEGYFTWHKYLKDGLLRIDSATFVSLLINGEALKQMGLPCKDYFIWGDDTEYTKRLTTYFGEAYLVGKSIVIHKRQGNGQLDIMNEEKEQRINMWYYMVRNNLLNTKTYSGRSGLLKTLKVYIILSIKILLKKGIVFRFKKFSVIIKGIIDYLFGNYDKEAFKNRLNS